MRETAKVNATWNNLQTIALHPASPRSTDYFYAPRMPPTLRSRKFSRELMKKNSILRIVRTSRRVWEVESYALSKFQPPTMLGDRQNVEKTIRKKFDLFGFRNPVFVIFPGFWQS